MISPVMIKGNKTGIRIIISEDACLTEILMSLEEKLSTTRDYCTSPKAITVTFEGKLLTEDEKLKILDTLRNKGINIVNPTQITKENPKQNTKQKNNTPDNNLKLQQEKTGLFYIGNLKNGQSITAMTSIVIVGDVEAGASVESTGNIVVIGKAEGILKSGYNGNPNTFIYSFNTK